MYLFIYFLKKEVMQRGIMFKNEIENCKKLKPMRHLNLLIGIRIVISKIFLRFEQKKDDIR